MNIFEELETQYLEIERQYSANQFSASQKRWNRKEARWQRKRELNDQAYFVLMFGRLEHRINALCEELITRKRRLSSWRQRDPWEIIPASEMDKVFFKNRVALLAGKGRTDYNLICSYYEERNSIAHGGAFIRQISVQGAVKEFQRLYKSLKN